MELRSDSGDSLYFYSQQHYPEELECMGHKLTVETIETSRSIKNATNVKEDIAMRSLMPVRYCCSSSAALEGSKPLAACSLESKFVFRSGGGRGTFSSSSSVDGRGRDIIGVVFAFIVRTVAWVLYPSD